MEPGVRFAPDVRHRRRMQYQAGTALNQAKEQPAKTGQPQQVVSVDRSGTTTTTIVQPPAPGETTDVSITTTRPPSAGTPDPPSSGPTVSGVPQPPPAPVNLTIPAGTRLTIRVDQRIRVKHTHEGGTFTGEIVEPVRSLDNIVVVPRGTPVGGVIAAAHRRSHFKGHSLLELRLASMTLNGKRYPLTTDDLTESKKDKGKRSTALIAGGSGLGMFVGGVATGGVGLVVERTGRQQCWNCRGGFDRKPRHRDTRGAYCSPQACRTAKGATCLAVSP
jgi:hypothetical protein